MCLCVCVCRSTTLGVARKNPTWRASSFQLFHNAIWFRLSRECVKCRFYRFTEKNSTKGISMRIWWNGDVRAGIKCQIKVENVKLMMWKWKILHKKVNIRRLYLRCYKSAFNWHSLHSRFTFSNICRVTQQRWMVDLKATPTTTTNFV